MGFKVKQLVWTDRLDGAISEPIPRFCYTIHKDEKKWVLVAESIWFTGYKSKKKAKAAAQEFYEDRILSCLEATQ